MRRYEFRFSVTESQRQHRPLFAFVDEETGEELFTHRLLGQALSHGRSPENGRLILECEITKRSDGVFETRAPEWEPPDVEYDDVLNDEDEHRMRVCYQHASDEFRVHDESDQNAWWLVGDVVGLLDWTWFDGGGHFHQMGPVALEGKQEALHQLSDHNGNLGPLVPAYDRAVMYPR